MTKGLILDEKDIEQIDIWAFCIAVNESQEQKLYYYNKLRKNLGLEAVMSLEEAGEVK